MINNIQKRDFGILALILFGLVGCSGVEIESRVRKETLFTDQVQATIECPDGLQPTQAALIDNKTLLTTCGEGDINLALQQDVNSILTSLSTKDENGKATFKNENGQNGQVQWVIAQSLTSPVSELKIHYLNRINYDTTDTGRKVSYTTLAYQGPTAEGQEIKVGEAARLYLANNTGIRVGGSPAKERIH